jgi:hypothetical protein
MRDWQRHVRDLADEIEVAGVLRDPPGEEPRRRGTDRPSSTMSTSAGTRLQELGEEHTPS